MDKVTQYRIETLIGHIDIVLNDTSGMHYEELIKNNLLLRATCFSVAQVGEMMTQIGKTLSEKYPALPWSDARKMRNVIVHDYKGADLPVVYMTIKYDLPKLKESFLEILKENNK